MTGDLVLRDVVEEDLPIFFEYQLDPEANQMAAFTAKDPNDQEAFTAHWGRILTAPTVIIRTIAVEGQVVGSVLSYEEEGRPEVSYWIGRAYWGRGIATRALGEDSHRSHRHRQDHRRQRTGRRQRPQLRGGGPS